MISISEERYIELIGKEKAFDDMLASRKRGAEKTNNISAEARRARAKKAVEARIKKYNQQTHIDKKGEV